jgi:hypothetical protein
MQYAREEVIQKEVDIVGDLFSSDDELSDVPSDLLFFNFGAIVLNFYEERILFSSFRGTEHKNCICRIYPEKGICVQKSQAF